MLSRSTLREIRTSLSRYLAIFSIAALGVGFFAGLRECQPSMVRTAADYLSEHSFFDYELRSSYGGDDDSVSLAESWEGVADAEGSVQIDVMTESGDGDAKALKAVSLPDSINTLRLVSGRLPESPDECAVDAYSVADDGYSIGDTVRILDDNKEDTLESFRYREFKIVGTVNTPLYLDYQRGSTDIGNGSLSTFFFIMKEAFDCDYYTSLYLTLDGAPLPFSEESEKFSDDSRDSMEALAERITADRREAVIRKAQKKLDRKRRKYETSLAEYRSEKADAEKKLSDAQDKIDEGYRTISSMKKEAQRTVRELKKAVKEARATAAELKANLKAAKTGRKELKSGIREAESGRTTLEQAHAAGLLSDAEYEAGKAEAGETLKTLRKKLAQTEKRISKIDAGLAEVNKGIVSAKAGIEKAESGLETLDKKKREADRNAIKLREERLKADRKFADAEKELADAAEKLEEAQEDIDSIETGSSYAFSRDENSGYSSFDSNSGIVSNIAKVFPVFFFLIAALVCMTTMTRMVEEQRTQIGVLKALGYSNLAVAGKYLFYSGSAAAMGAAAGFFIGCRFFPAVIWKAYTMMYDFSDSCAFVFDPVLGILSLAAALLCSMGATWFAIARSFREAPSELIRPRSLPAGRRILLERISFIWNRLSFLYKVSFRNIFRDKKRFLMMVIGVSGCTALLVAGMGIRTTVAKVADHQFDEISHYDLMTVFSRNMNERRRESFNDYMSRKAGIHAEDILYIHQAEVTAALPGSSFEATCTAAEPEDFGRYIDLHEGDEPIAFPGRGEAVIAKKLHHDYGIGTGDRITLRDGYREMNVTVSGIADNYVYDNIYISLDTYEEGFGRKAPLKTALILMHSDEGTAPEDSIRAAGTSAANYEHSAAVSVSIDVRENVAKMMNSLDSVVIAVILSAALLAFIVLYNLTNINITERVREIATIKVLGFNRMEVSQYVFRENFFLTAFAAAAGLPLGKCLLDFVIDKIVVKMIYFEPRITYADYGAAVLLTFVFAAAVNLAMQKRLSDVSMTESLKSVE